MRCGKQCCCSRGFLFFLDFVVTLRYSDDVTSGESAVGQRVTSARDDDVAHDAAVTCVVYADDVHTDDRVTSLEGKHQMSLQSMKELLLSSVSSAVACIMPLH